MFLSIFFNSIYTLETLLVSCVIHQEVVHLTNEILRFNWIVRISCAPRNVKKISIRIGGASAHAHIQYQITDKIDTLMQSKSQNEKKILIWIQFSLFSLINLSTKKNPQFSFHFVQQTKFPFIIMNRKFVSATLLIALSFDLLFTGVLSTSGLETITDENLVDLAKTENYLIVLFCKYCKSSFSSMTWCIDYFIVHSAQ